MWAVHPSNATDSLRYMLIMVRIPHYTYLVNASLQWNSILDTDSPILDHARQSWFSTAWLRDGNQAPIYSRCTHCNIQKYPGLFHDIGKLKDTQVKLHVDKTVKPKAITNRRTPFHLRTKVETELNALNSKTASNMYKIQQMTIFHSNYKYNS